MKRLMFIAIALFLLKTNAQLSSTWTTELNGNFEWHFVDVNGNYLVKTSTGLHSFDPETGKKQWSNQMLTNIIQEDITELPNSGYLLIMDGINKVVVNPFSGEVIFESAEQGFTKVNYQNFLPLSNQIVVAGERKNKPVLTSVDATSGKTNWNLEEKFGKIFAVKELDQNHSLILTLFDIYKLNQHGDIIWKKSVTGAEEKEDNALMGLLKDVANQAASNLEPEMFLYVDYDNDRFIIASEIESVAVDTSGKEQISYETEYYAFKISDGQSLWGDTVAVGGKNSQVIFYNDGVLIFPNEKSRSTLNFYKFDGNTTGEWGKKGRGVNSKGGVQTALNLGNKFLIASSSGESTGFIDIIDVQTGELQLKKPIKVKGNVQLMELVGNSVFFVTDQEADIIDLATGDLMLDKSIPSNPSLVYIENSKAIIFDEKSSTIKQIDLKTYQVTDLTSTKLKFEGKESPTNLELYNDGLLLSSSQNIVLFDKSGKMIYQSYFDAPKESGLMKALLYAQAARAAYIGANAYAASASLQSYQSSGNDPVGDAIVTGVGSIYQEIGDQASDFVKESFARAKDRAKATTKTRDYMVVLTQEKKEISLLKVNKSDGQVKESISLGSDKNPTYTLDDVTGSLFLLNANNQIQMYKLE